jgi:hypothetical protein
MDATAAVARNLRNVRRSLIGFAFPSRGSGSGLGS